MHLALRPRLVPGGGQNLWQGRMIGEWLQMAFIASTARRITVQTSHDGGAGRHADGTAAVGPRKCNAFVAQPIELWRHHMVIAQRADGIKALLVSGDKQNVGLFAHRPKSVSTKQPSQHGPK